MTKQEAIEKTRALLEVLRGIPEEADIISASANDFLEECISIHLQSGIELVSEALSIPAEENYGNDGFKHRRIRRNNFYIVQLDPVDVK